ncbi:MAG: hypothetical protein EOO73_09115 [Myxococcales bacterium]|nr:MAG: hypothetical protein EOO73_09115 [Myxococcales bacterium]
MSEVLARKRDPPGKIHRERWREAKRFQRRVQSALVGLRVSFSEWLVLSTIDELGLEHGENVSQNLVAERTGLTRVTAGHWARVLERKGLVDRGEHYNLRAWGVVLTQEGASTLERCNERLAFVAGD